MSQFRMAPDLNKLNAQWIGAIKRKDSNLPEGRDYHSVSDSSEKGERWRATNPLSKRSIYLRRTFKVQKRVKSAIVYISGLGHYELSLNGKKIGNDQFNPLWSDYDKTVYYNGYDLTAELTRGKMQWAYFLEMDSTTSRADGTKDAGKLWPSHPLSEIVHHLCRRINSRDHLRQQVEIFAQPHSLQQHVRR